MTETRKLAAILAADVVGYSRLAGTDEDRTLARLRALRSDLIDPTIAVHHGRVVKRTGDGSLIEFRSVVDAVRCAIEVQNGMIERNAGLPPERRIEFRVGIHLGDVVEESDGDLMGDGVNIAARLEGIAKPGSICLSEDAYRLVKARLDLAVSDLGPTQLKNIVEPVRVYSLEVGVASKALPATQREAAAHEMPSAQFALSDKPSIAVLPFANMSGDPEQEHFADGIAEDIITSLSRLRGFFVIARNSTFTYKGRAIEVKTIARELGVRYVLEGSIRKATNRVRVTAQLIDGQSGNHVWAERYDRELKDIFAVQDEITESIAGAIEPQLHVAEIIRAQHKTPSSLNAWELVMQAMDRISRFTEADSRAGMALLDRAIAADTGYSRAYAHKAWLTVWRAFQGWDAMGPALAEASDSVAKALQFDADDPWAYVARTILCIATRGGGETVAAARKAVELNPNFAYGHSFLGAGLALAGDGDGALAAIAHAIRLSPRDLMRDEFDLFFAFAWFQKGDYAKAADFAAEAATVRPGHAYPNIMLAASSALAGDQQRAAAALARVQALVPGFNRVVAANQNAYVREDDRARLMTGLQKAGLSA
ncbi:adenylate/guanylate cyclase domain-containing protein [Bradyrhizobium sp. CCBAU 53421]|uniref:adenylate/guanylate cyclase domain-containing protein n=1 Tax=Bradyrhizobium sp. CCBAU 53421 TaxID=1325120 RepID=UPI00188D0CAD|nr:adenylate/guanylate cyclase domain-containing protein [Bradyrhizobium sp. CCBAU 53421]QOZ32762.1 adenylate/guanylate cyclase domain-containing protein [Bradyrhizobium sp. CCBAU 53421]